MRVLVLENETSSRRGGQELSLLDVCEGLRLVATRSCWRTCPAGDLDARYRRFCERMVQVSTYAVDRSRTVPSAVEWLSSLWKVSGSAPDIVYANQYPDSLFAAAIKRLFPVPFVCHLRLPPPDSFCGQFRVGMSRASHLIAISEQTRRDWIDRGFRADAIEVVHNGIDFARFGRTVDPAEARRGMGLPPEPFLMTFAGRLHPAKGVETLLEAVPLVMARRSLSSCRRRTPVEYERPGWPAARLPGRTTRHAPNASASTDMSPGSRTRTTCRSFCGRAT